MVKFSSERRHDTFSQLTTETLDILVIGGGITGAGISLDAATRGLKTGLVEMQDFAAGTSSRSTKLVHGGLRYLEQFEFKIVAEVGKERAIVYENGPHVTTPEWMMLPFYKGGTFGAFTTNIGLRVYDFLAGVKKGERRQMFSVTEALKREPLLEAKNLKGAGYYVEYKTDDARLTIEVLKKSVEHGTHAINYAKVVDFIYDEASALTGVVVEDQISGDRHKVFAKKIINASGPWVDEMRTIDGSKQGKTLHLTKGVHLVFSKEDFPLQQAVYFDGTDGRMIFAIPRDNKTYVGTTDTTYTGDIAHPTLTEGDCDYLLSAINHMFPTLQLSTEHIHSSWAGLRPLIAEAGKNPDEISRKDEVFISKTGLISMAGGKLTGYRKMAEDVIDLVVKQLKEEEGILYSSCETLHLPISGGEVGGSQGFQAFKQKKVSEGVTLGLEEEVTARMVQQYGANIDHIFQIYQERYDEAKQENIDPLVFARLIYAIDYELAYTPADFFIRRTGALYFDVDWVNDHQHAVTQYLAKQFQWSEETTENHQAYLEQLLEEATHPAKNV